MIKINKSKYKFDRRSLESFAQKVQKEMGVEGDITIVFGSGDESARLSRQFLGKDYSTDVLSFPNNEKIGNRIYLGDIFICFDIASEQAEQSGLEIFDELKALITHGILHLSGYDHEKDDGEMMKKQDQILKIL